MYTPCTHGRDPEKLSYKWLNPSLKIPSLANDKKEDTWKGSVMRNHQEKHGKQECGCYADLVHAFSNDKSS